MSKVLTIFVTIGKIKTKIKLREINKGKKISPNRKLTIIISTNKELAISTNWGLEITTNRELYKQPVQLV